MKLSNDSFALFLLCSHLGLPDDPDAKPLSAREWNQFEQKLANSFDIEDLPGSSAAQIKSTLQITDDEAARLAWLLDRGGVDKTAMGAAIAAGGTAAGLLADSLEKAMRAADARTHIEEGQLALATPYSPHASFNVGMAMARNKLIYALSDFGLVIASDAE